MIFHVFTRNFRSFRWLQVCLDLYTLYLARFTLSYFFALECLLGSGLCGLWNVAVLMLRSRALCLCVSFSGSITLRLV